MDRKKSGILALDVGSSSVRAVLYDDALNSVTSTTRQYSFTYEPPGAAVVDADEVRDLTEACLTEILPTIQDWQIAGVGMATFVGNVLGVDAAGKAVTPIYTYADTRNADQVESLRAQMDVNAVHQRTGCVLHTAYLPGRLLWLHETTDTSGVVQWVDFATYCYRHWFGQDVPCSYSVAAWTGLLNRADLTWDAAWLKVLHLNKEQLPALADYDAFQQGLVPDYAQRWQALADVPFGLAVGDGAAANIGSGAADGSIALTIGTTSALRRVVLDTLPSVPSGLWSYRVDAARHLIGGALTEGGNVWDWARQTLNLPELAELNAALEKLEPDSHGLTFLPTLAGERSPGWRGDMTGRLDGLRLSTTPLDMVQAALEGVALRLALIAEQLAPNSAEPVMAAGGALAALPAWGQMIADALNRPLHLIDAPQATARGVALLMRAALGMGALTDFAPPIARTIAPRAPYVATLRRARERQMRLYEQGNVV